ncbi:MAG TPA: hypothetical protein VKC62_03940 [Gaiellaceae bacterium]|nr:hypothetical protein [Gaiellaceae bacterium]
MARHEARPAAERHGRDFNKADLLALRDLLERGEVTPVVSERYMLVDSPRRSVRWAQATRKARSS